MHPFFLFIGFFFLAIANNMLGPLVANIMQTTGLSLSQSGSLISFQQIGAFSALLLSLFIMKRLRQITVTRLGYGVMIVALGGIFLIRGTSLLFVFYALIGFAAFYIDSGSNAVLASDYYEKRATYISLLHFCFSTGAIVTGFIVLPFKGETWPFAYGLLALAIALVLILASLQRRIKGSVQQSTSQQEGKAEPEPILTLLRDKAFILYALVLVCYGGSQLICAAWIPVYVETELLQSPTMTASSLTVFWIGIAISRLIMGPILKTGVNEFTLSLVGMLLAGMALFLLPLSSNIVVVLLLASLCGFFAGATIPMFIVVAATWFPQNTAFISLSYILSGTIGKAIFPWLVTKIAETQSLGLGLQMSSILLFLCAGLLVLVERAARARKGTRKSAVNAIPQ